jgi:hypothetical protein
LCYVYTMHHATQQLLPTPFLSCFLVTVQDASAIALAIVRLDEGRKRFLNAQAIISNTTSPIFVASARPTTPAPTFHAGFAPECQTATRCCRFNATDMLSYQYFCYLQSGNLLVPQLMHQSFGLHQYSINPFGQAL